MREFKRKSGMTAALIVAFKGTGDIIVTDDDDEIDVGHAWIAQRMPKVGDAIYLAHGQYCLMSSRTLVEYEIPDPVGQPVFVAVDPASEPGPWYLVYDDGSNVQDEDGDLLFATEAEALTHIAENDWDETPSPVPF